MSDQADPIVDTPPPQEGGESGWSMPSLPSIPPEVIDTVVSGLSTMMSYAVPLFVLYNLYQLGKYIYKYVMTLRVEGKPNEWIVIMRGGDQVRAGIGLSCFRSPYESIAQFPSSLVKVEVRTQQVTKEMQGIEVMSMIEWTVDRDFPLKAYKNLDLASGSFRVANDTLSCMTSAIVRNQIANSTIDHIIKNRQEIREKVLDEMSEVVKGWGVHLATVEVIDVKILSSSLFKDMQAKFREENQKKATLERLVVQNAIYFEQLDKTLEKNKRDSNTQKITCQKQNEGELKTTREEVEQYRQQCELAKKEIIRQNQESLRKKQNDNKLKLKALEREIQAVKLEVDTACRKEISRREIQEQKDNEKRVELNQRIQNDKLKSDNALSLKQADYDLLKEGFKDPIVSKLQYMNLIGELYGSLSFGGININHMSSEDPVAQIVQKFTTMARGDSDINDEPDIAARR